MITMRSRFKRAKPAPETPPDTLNVERHWYEYARNKIESQKVLLRGFIGLTLCCAGFTYLTWQQQVQIEALRHKPVEHVKAVGLGENGQVLCTDGSDVTSWVTPGQHVFDVYRTTTAGSGGGGGGMYCYSVYPVPHEIK